MLLIQAEAKKYVEQAKFEGKDTIDGIEVKGKVLSITESTEYAGYYKINNMSVLGLDELSSEKYLIVYDISTIDVDVYYTPGVKDSDGNT